MSTARVLMNLKTGELMEGHRISLFDKGNKLDVGTDYKVSLEVLTHDGWIIYHPQIGKFAFFLNVSGEKFFEDLGELG